MVCLWESDRESRGYLRRQRAGPFVIVVLRGSFCHGWEGLLKVLKHLEGCELR